MYPAIFFTFTVFTVTVFSDRRILGNYRAKVPITSADEALKI